MSMVDMNLPLIYHVAAWAEERCPPPQTHTLTLETDGRVGPEVKGEGKMTLPSPAATLGRTGAAPHLSSTKILFLRTELHSQSRFLSYLDISSLWHLQDDFMTPNRWAFFLYVLFFTLTGKEQLFELLFSHVFSKPRFLF